MVQIENIADNVDLIRLPGKTIYLVGTAHISQKSAELSEEAIRNFSPNSVAVELCASRFHSLQDPDRWKNTDILSVIKQGKVYVLLTQLVLAAFQKKLGKQLNVTPGAEMMRALSVAQELGVHTTLADRDITTTLKRTWASLGFWSIAKLFWFMTVGLFADKSISEEEIERLKTSDALEELMKEFTEKLPEVRTALIDERDQYLAQKIKNSDGATIVAIMGAGHVPGIKKWIAQDYDLSPLEVIPPPRLGAKIIGWLIPGIAVAMVVYGFFTAGAATSIDMIWAWILITGFSAAIGAALALSHPITVLSAFVAAPITALHPILASGWVAGLVEAIIRKPKVSDFQSVADDIVTIRGCWRNGLTRILLVVILTNLVGSIGTIFALGQMGSMLNQ